MRFSEQGRRIDMTDRHNRLIARLGEEGFSVDCITEEVNKVIGRGVWMTPYQVYYRLQLAGVPLRDVRGGMTERATKRINTIRVQLYKPRVRRNAI